MFLNDPGGGLVALALLLIVFFIVGGMARIVFALTSRCFKRDAEGFVQSISHSPNIFSQVGVQIACSPVFPGLTLRSIQCMASSTPFLSLSRGPFRSAVAVEPPPLFPLSSSRLRS